MEWLKLFTLLVAVASISVKADGPKKKIRIHLPQKVKHIHHHKKIYITNHPAPSQYAPAYMPNAEGTVAVPTSVALPAMANILPINPVDLYDENPSRLPPVASAASHILPLYHARGYYGPTPSDIEDTEEDISENEEYVPQSYPALPPTHQSKRLKIIKVNEPPRKKIIKKIKPKRIVLRNKPLPPPNADGEHPVSTFHEQFYSDIDGTGTIRKIKKPPRFEKIVDGDTEHIHTYSEEHIHKMIVGDSKLNGVVGVDPFNGLPVISNGQHVIPIKGGHQLLAVASNPFTGVAAVGAINNQGQFEYSPYNPREVTHDHIFHDHGEIPADVDINKDTLGLPPKVSYNSQGLRISSSNRPKSKNYHQSKKSLKPSSGDFSYYESIYSPSHGPSKVQRPSLTIPSFDASEEENYEAYKVQEQGYKDSYKKPRNHITSYYSNNDYRIQQSSPPAPFSTSSTIVHDYKPKRYSGSSHAGLTKLRDPFANFKDSYSNNFEYDTYASSSNIYTSEDKNDVEYSRRGKNGKKKSISTQNISFGGKDHLSFVDHMKDESFLDSFDGDGPTALENVEQFDQQQNSDIATQPSFTLKDNTPSHEYYSLMAAKALHGDQMSAPDGSNDNFQYAEPPSASTTGPSPAPSTPDYYNLQSTENPHMEPSKFSKESKLRNPKTGLLQNQESKHSHSQDSLLVRGKLKYGDKI